MKVFISIKYHADQNNRGRIEAIASALEQCGCHTICVVRDIEEWGRAHFEPAELMRRTFAEIDSSDLVVIELTEKGVGVGIEAGYAHAKQIPIVTVAQEYAVISETMRGISRRTFAYAGLCDLPALAARILECACQN